MAPEVEYKASVERDLKKIDKKQINRLLDKIEDVLSEYTLIIPADKCLHVGLYHVPEQVPTHLMAVPQQSLTAIVAEMSLMKKNVGQE